MTPWFIATKRFDSTDQGWASYIDFSGLLQLTEVVSLDGLLCPSLTNEFKEEYWPYVVQEDFLLHFFLTLISWRFLSFTVRDGIPRGSTLAIAFPTRWQSGPGKRCCLRARILLWRTSGESADS